MKVSVVVPTKNAGAIWQDCVQSICAQTVKFENVLIMDSISDDSTRQIAESAGFDVILIDPDSFNHGGTRNLSVNYLQKSDFVVFLTQDSVLASNNAISQILAPFLDADVMAVCGRQIPHQNANPIAKHARLFNYPEKSLIKSNADIPSLGIKTVFLSNSFSAYRVSFFLKSSGFPSCTILAEDMYYAAKVIEAGYKVVYCAEAITYHSHNYSPWEEFRRYFDTGVFHASEPWIKQQFGGPAGEGKRFFISELRYLLKHNPAWIPRAIIATICKFCGYNLGFNYNRLPERLVVFFSMNKRFWYKKN